MVDNFDEFGEWPVIHSKPCPLTVLSQTSSMKAITMYQSFLCQKYALYSNKTYNSVMHYIIYTLHTYICNTQYIEGLLTLYSNISILYIIVYHISSYTPVYSCIISYSIIDYKDTSIRP